MIIQKALWKNNKVLEEDCRNYHKTVVGLTKFALKLNDRAQCLFGVGVLCGLLFGLAMAHLMIYLSGRI